MRRWQPVKLARVSATIALDKRQRPAMRERFDLEPFLHTALIGPHGLGDKAVDIEVSASNDKGFRDWVEHADRLSKTLVDAPKADARQNVFPIILERIACDIIKGQDTQNIIFRAYISTIAVRMTSPGLSLAASTIVSAMSSFLLRTCHAVTSASLPGGQSGHSASDFGLPPAVAETPSCARLEDSLDQSNALAIAAMMRPGRHHQRTGAKVRGLAGGFERADPFVRAQRINAVLAVDNVFAFLGNDLACLIQDR